MQLGHASVTMASSLGTRLIGCTIIDSAMLSSRNQFSPRRLLARAYHGLVMPLVKRKLLARAYRGLVMPLVKRRLLARAYRGLVMPLVKRKCKKAAGAKPQATLGGGGACHPRL